MSLRMVAVELYRVMKEVEGLERKLESLDTRPQEKQGIEDTLRKARAEMVRLKKMVEGAKGD